MRLIGRSKPEEPSTKTADFVLQLGSSKFPLPAEKLVGAAARIDDEHLRQLSTQSCASNDEDKAVDALMRMRQTLSTTSATAASGQWSPWSPDDFPSTRNQQLATSLANSRLAAPELPAGWDRRPSNFLPEHYEPSQHPTYFCPAVPNPVTSSTMPLRSKPTIFDGLGEMPRRQTSSSGPTRTRDSTSTKKSRKLDLGQLFPRSPSTCHHSTSKADASSRTGRARSGTGSTSSTSKAGNPRRVPCFGDDVVQATKTNVRRPPKGIQNWFDGFISDDDDDEEEEDENEEEDEDDEQYAGFNTIRQTIPHVMLQLEPQELPAEEIAPPAYSGPTRGGSVASMRSNHSYTPGDDNPPPFHHGDEKAPIDRSESVSTGTHSLQSSQSQRRRNESRLAQSQLANESVLALTDHSASETDEEDRQNMGTIRDSIIDDQNIRLGAAAKVNLHQLRAGQDIVDIRARSSESATSPLRENIRLDTMQHRQYFSRHDQRAAKSFDPTVVALRRLNGHSMVDSRGSTSSSSTFDMENRSVLAGDSISNVPSEASHLMAVTDEERMLLDMVRRNRAAMPQMSYTEGYQAALQREQTSPMRRSASADSTTQQILDQRESQTDMTSHEIMRKKLSGLRKQDVDEALKMARFLGMHSPSEEEGTWLRDSMMPTALPTSKPRSDGQNSESQSPIQHRYRDSPSSTWSPGSEEYRMLNQPWSRKQMTTNALLSSSPSMISPQRISLLTRNDVLRPPVLEEEPIPYISERQPNRGRQNQNTKSAKRLSRSVDANPMLQTTDFTSNPTAFDRTSASNSSPSVVNFSPTPTSPLSSIITAASLGGKHRRQIGAETPESEVSQHGFGRATRPPRNALPATRTRESGLNPRASMTNSSGAGEVLAAWAELGGGSDCLQQNRRPQVKASHSK